MTLVDEVRAAQRLPDPDVAKMIRVTAGVSQRRLAEELGVHPMTVLRWEAGTRRPRGDMRARYARLLDMLRREVAS
jgi:transcriptional regulator with XRE-family HTH domain